VIIVVSPAKKLGMEPKKIVGKATQPQFLNEANALVDILREKSSKDLQKLMGISEKLGDLNAGRYQEFETPFTPENAKQAMYAFQGDTYVGLDAESLSKDDAKYAQDHLRILSGLYGLLRPLDLMQAYRLEMGTRLENKNGKNLYDFWGDKLTNALNKESGPVINLASNEYISSIQADDLKDGMITPVFKELKENGPKVIGLFAKRARGMMARYIIENRIEDVADLKNFDIDGYQFQPKASSDSELVFLRDQQLKAAS
jgi:hypothetical protein